jgi:hypothetical protein
MLWREDQKGGGFSIQTYWHPDTLRELKLRTRVLTNRNCGVSMRSGFLGSGFFRVNLLRTRREDLSTFTFDYILNSSARL